MSKRRKPMMLHRSLDGAERRLDIGHGTAAATDLVIIDVVGAGEELGARERVVGEGLWRRKGVVKVWLDGLVVVGIAHGGQR